MIVVERYLVIRLPRFTVSAGLAETVKRGATGH